MKDLIDALKIILKYLKNPNAYAPIVCNYEVMYVNDVKVNEIDFNTIKKIYNFGFIPRSDENCNMI